MDVRMDLYLYNIFRMYRRFWLKPWGQRRCSWPFTFFLLIFKWGPPHVCLFTRIIPRYFTGLTCAATTSYKNHCCSLALCIRRGHWWDRFAKHPTWWKTHTKISKKESLVTVSNEEWKVFKQFFSVVCYIVVRVLQCTYVPNAIAMHHKHSNVSISGSTNILYGDDPLTRCPSRQPSHALLHYGLCAYGVNTFNVLWTVVQYDKKINVHLCGGDGGGGDRVV